MTSSFHVLINCYWPLRGMEHHMSSSPVYNWMTMDPVLYGPYVHKWIYNGFYGHVMPVRLPIIALLFVQHLHYFCLLFFIVPRIFEEGGWYGCSIEGTQSQHFDQEWINRRETSWSRLRAQLLYRTDFNTGKKTDKFRRLDFRAWSIPNYGAEV